MPKRSRLTACAWIVAVAATSGCALMGSDGGNTPPPKPSQSADKNLPTPDPSPTTTAPATWASVYADAQTGVVRLDVSSCDASATGTGFLISPTLVGTVAHVVEDSTHIRVTSPTQSEVAAGTVIGLDHDHDLALVSLSRPMTGHVFTLSADPPPIGTEIGMVGFPLGRSMQLTTGTISSNHDRRQVGSAGEWHAELSNRC